MSHKHDACVAGPRLTRNILAHKEDSTIMGLTLKPLHPVFVAEATVKAHVSHILTKLDLENRVQVAICAYEAGLV